MRLPFFPLNASASGSGGRSRRARRAPIEGKLDDLGRSLPAPDLDHDPVSDPKCTGFDHREGDGITEEERMRAAGDDADTLAACHHRGPVAGDVAGLGLEPDQSPARALGLDLLERVAADETALAKLDRPTQAGLVGVHRLIHVIAPPAHGSLDAGRVCRPRPRPQEPRLSAARGDRAPALPDAVL